MARRNEPTRAMSDETSIQKMKTKHILFLLTAAALSACSNMQTSSGPFVNTPALQQMGDTFDRANAYQRKGYSPGDAWGGSALRQSGRAIRAACAGGPHAHRGIWMGGRHQQLALRNLPDILLLPDTCPGSHRIRCSHRMKRG